MNDFPSFSLTTQTIYPLLVVISGSSGVGKDSVIRRMKERQLPFNFIVTATTRPPREDEIHGIDYFFFTQEKFAEMIENEEFLEYALVYDDYKGIPKEQVQRALEDGKDLMIRVDVQGAATIRKLCPEALLIFLTAQNDDEMIDRLRKRRSESAEAFALRVATARQEIKRIDEFDYLVVNQNGKLDETVNTILSIVHSEHHRVNHRKVTL